MHPKRLADGGGTLGKQEQAVPLVISPKATGPESEGQHKVATSLQLGAESPPRPGSVPAHSRRILPENKARPKDFNNPDELMAERRRAGSVVDPGPAIFLAGVAAADEVAPPGVGRLGREGLHVIPSKSVGPVSFEDSPGILVLFNLPHRSESAGAFQPKVEAPHPGKK